GDTEAVERFVLNFTVGHDEAGERLLGDDALRQCGVLVLRRKALNRIEHQGGILDGLAMDTRAISRLFAGDAAVHNDALGRYEKRDVISGSRPLAGCRALFTDGAGSKVGGHRDARAITGATRNAGGVVRVAGLAAPGSVLQVSFRNHRDRLVVALRGGGTDVVR